MMSKVTKHAMKGQHSRCIEISLMLALQLGRSPEHGVCIEGIDLPVTLAPDMG